MQLFDDGHYIHTSLLCAYTRSKNTSVNPLLEGDHGTLQVCLLVELVVASVAIPGLVRGWEAGVVWGRSDLQAHTGACWQSLLAWQWHPLA